MINYGEAFEKNEEIDRLRIQNRLLKPYEEPVYQKIIESGSNLRVLDIGCNDGCKTVERFRSDRVSKVIGLEYHEALAQQAQKTYGGIQFAFYQCDVEGEDFVQKLSSVMSQNDMEAFDIIHLSFVLSHLKAPEALLHKLYNFLSPCGQLVVVEANDEVSSMAPDSMGIFQEALALLAKDPLSGDRSICSKIPDLLLKNGYCKLASNNLMIRADGSEQEKKADIFETYFSFLLEDIKMLLWQEPENVEYQFLDNQLEQKLDGLKKTVMEADTQISMGITTFVCTKDMGIRTINDMFFERLTPSYVDAAAALCDQLVGKNLYTRECLTAVLQKPNHEYYVLLTPENNIAGYIYYYLADLQEAAELSKLSHKQLAVISSKKNPVVGIIRAIGVDEAYRHKGLSVKLLDFCLKQLQTKADAAFGVCWKPDGHVPIEKALIKFQFHHLTDAHLIWYDNENLICPFCKGRCRCDGAIYYKTLSKEGNNL